MEVFYIITSTIVYLYVFWCLYIAVMGVYRAHLAKRLYGLAKVIAVPLVIVGLVTDIFCQYTIATIIFLDAPRSKEHLVTTRLIRYVNNNTDWRYNVAAYICSNLLDIFDPTNKHCATDIK